MLRWRVRGGGATRPGRAAAAARGAGMPPLSRRVQMYRGVARASMAGEDPLERAAGTTVALGMLRVPSKELGVWLAVTRWWVRGAAARGPPLGRDMGVAIIAIGYPRRS